MTTEIKTDLGQQRWLRCRNAYHNKVLQAYGAVRIIGTEFDKDGIIYHVKYPDPATYSGSGGVIGVDGKPWTDVITGGFSSGNGLAFHDVSAIGFMYQNDTLPNEIGLFTFDTPAYCRCSSGAFLALPSANLLGVESGDLVQVTSLEIGTPVLSGFRVLTLSFPQYSNGPATIAIRAAYGNYWWEGIYPDV